LDNFEVDNLEEGNPEEDNLEEDNLVVEEDNPGVDTPVVVVFDFPCLSTSKSSSPQAGDV